MQLSPHSSGVRSDTEECGEWVLLPQTCSPAPGPAALCSCWQVTGPMGAPFLISRRRTPWEMHIYWLYVPSTLKCASYDLLDISFHTEMKVRCLSVCCCFSLPVGQPVLHAKSARAVGRGSAVSLIPSLVLFLFRWPGSWRWDFPEVMLWKP